MSDSGTFLPLSQEEGNAVELRMGLVLPPRERGPVWTFDWVELCSVLFLAIWVLLAANPAHSGERALFQTAELAVLAERTAEPTARHLLLSYAQVSAELQQALGWSLRYKPTVVLVQDPLLFEQMGGGPFVSAFALPREQTMVINLPAVSSESYRLNETFKHELCHLVLHDHIRRTSIPKWLDEGVCQWVSGSMGELLVSGKEHAGESVDLVRSVFPMAQIAERFPEGRRPLLLAYEQSRRFIDYISAQYGKQSLLNILGHMKEGARADRAFFKVLSKPFDDVEAEWRERVRDKSLWLIWISQYVYEALFFLCAVLAIPAFIRLKRRLHRYTGDEEDAQEGSMLPAPPDTDQEGKQHQHPEK